MQQGLTARETQAGHPQAHGGANHREPFLQGQQTIGLLAIGKAIGAGKIAASRQRQAQNPEGPLVLIQGSAWLQGKGHAGGKYNRLGELNKSLKKPAKSLTRQGGETAWQNKQSIPQKPSFEPHHQR
jgi:hypothetical protein